VTIGLDADADDFVSGIRYSMPVAGGEEGTPSYEWVSSVASLFPIKIFLDKRHYRMSPSRYYTPPGITFQQTISFR